MFQIVSHEYDELPARNEIVFADVLGPAAQAPEKLQNLKLSAVAGFFALRVQHIRKITPLIALDNMQIEEIESARSAIRRLKRKAKSLNRSMVHDYSSPSLSRGG